jgi:O-antigen biosynthesis protein WbqP
VTESDMKTIHTGVIRCVDFAAALGGGLLLLPVVVVVGLLVRRDSPGPALFRQERVGLNERRFTCLKLRTMSVGTPVAGTHEVQASAVTPLGRRLRHLKLDELPQLWNVIRGDMSLVGPRPCLPSQVELIEARRARGVFQVRPGVTGPAQVQGLDMSTPVALAEEDAIWAARPTVPQYFRLIFQTLGGRGQGDRIRAG